MYNYIEKKLKEHKEYAEGIAKEIIQDNKTEHYTKEKIDTLINEKVDSYCNRNVWNTDLANPSNDRIDTYYLMIDIVTDILIHERFGGNIMSKRKQLTVSLKGNSLFNTYAQQGQKEYFSTWMVKLKTFEYDKPEILDIELKNCNQYKEDIKQKQFDNYIELLELIQGYPLQDWEKPVYD